MNATLFPVELEAPRSRAGIVPRDYQIQAHDESIRLWNAGVLGVLVRGATGCGKTIISSLIGDTWLQRSDNHRVMVVSYEQHLVWQFAQEVEDVLGITPGIEMGSQSLDSGSVPKIVIASRQTLAPRKPPTPEQLGRLAHYGIHRIGALPGEKVSTIIHALDRGAVGPEEALAEIARLNSEPEANGTAWARLHKFDPTYHWMVVFDEAHKYKAAAKQTAPLLEWFDRNPESRRLGITATPKRFDGVSIGHKLFPGIALDYPLLRAVAAGWAVPYRQLYLKCVSVDFRTLGKLGKDFSPDAIEATVGEEKQIGILVEGVLQRTGDRRTLIFSATVVMAKKIVAYINARSHTACECGALGWHANLSLHEGIACAACGKLLTTADVDRSDQARELDGSIPHTERKSVYDGHQAGQFQFLSVCMLAREGYNDPDVSCIAILRPISEDASSLAEQMKGRSCRPLRGCVNSDMTAEQRITAIAASRKPDALIIDLVGITGLADCASTLDIYAEGLPDEIRARAQQLMLDAVEPIAPTEAIEEAEREDREARAKAAREREEAEAAARRRREEAAKAGIEVKYTEHEVGVVDQSTRDPAAASTAMLSFMRFLGLEITGNVYLKKKTAGMAISWLKEGLNPNDVAARLRLSVDEWRLNGPTMKQRSALVRAGVATDWIITRYQACLAMSCLREPTKFRDEMTAMLSGARTAAELHYAGDILRHLRPKINPELLAQLVEVGKTRKSQLTPTEF